MDKGARRQRKERMELAGSMGIVYFVEVCDGDNSMDMQSLPAPSLVVLALSQVSSTP